MPKKQETFTYDALPNEIKMNIFKQLPPTTLAKISGVSTQWKNLADDDYLWEEKFIELGQKNGIHFDLSRFDQTNYKTAFYRLRELHRQYRHFPITRKVKCLLQGESNHSFANQYLFDFNRETYRDGKFSLQEAYKIALITDNEPLIHYLLEPAQLGASLQEYQASQLLLDNAIRFGCITAVKILLSIDGLRDEPLIKQGYEGIDFALSSHNLSTLKRHFSYKHSKVGLSLLEMHLQQVIYHNGPEMFKFLVSLKNQTNIAVRPIKNNPELVMFRLDRQGDDRETNLVNRCEEHVQDIERKRRNGEDAKAHITPIQWLGLIEACEYTKWGMAGIRFIRKLIEYGADFNIKDSEGMTVLHLSAMLRKWNTPRRLTRIFECGADINAIDNNGMKPLDVAIQYRNHEMVDYLYNNGENSQPRLHIAVQCFSALEIKNLVDKGADINERNEDGMTALHLAALHGTSGMVNLLKTHGADMNAKDNKGMTALHWAAERGHGNTAKLLVMNGADVDSADNKGMTALHWAVKNKNNADVVNALVEGGADLNVKDSNSETAFVDTMDSEQPKIVFSLRLKEIVKKYDNFVVYKIGTHLGILKSPINMNSLKKQVVSLLEFAMEHDLKDAYGVFKKDGALGGIIDHHQYVYTHLIANTGTRRKINQVIAASEAKRPPRMQLRST